VIRPLGDKVVVKPGPEEEKSEGGILLPDTAKKKPQRGEVLAVGPGKLLEDGRRGEMSVKKGDMVIYSKYGGTDITYKGEDYVILDEDQILAVED